MSAETLLMNFDLEGIAVSSGSACSSGKVTKSHVLTAMSVAPELAKGAILAEASGAPQSKRGSMTWQTSTPLNS
jgi:cysteine sulfinate desulfinase/cysteine desulfurase-like protein